MITFDFISGEDFRHSLEADYRELNSAMQVGAWKAVHVLSGSIIEAILIDYLISSAYVPKPKQRPNLLDWDLNEAIETCESEKIISKRTAQLSYVIRSYRNLIHAGRLIRLGEQVNENGAKIAQALLEMIVDEISERRKQNYGFTAEQIVTKLENDSSAVAIIGHNLKETSEYEKERLLLRVLPLRYSDLFDSERKPEKLLLSLISCFRLAFDNVSTSTKEKVIKEFVKALKEENSDVQWRYAFFRGRDLEYTSSPEDRNLIKEHLLSLMEFPIKIEFLLALEGIGKFLTKKECGQMLAPLINSITNYEEYYDSKAIEVEDIFNIFKKEYALMSKENKETISDQLKHLYKKYKHVSVLASTIKMMYEKVNLFKDIDDDVDYEHPF